MGFLGALFGDGSEDVKKALAAFNVDDPDAENWSEVRVRNAVQKHLSATLAGIELRREAGIAGMGTRIDLYAHYREHDYLITMKKGLSEQKIKKVIGEISIFLQRWRSSILGKKTYVIFFFFSCKGEHELDYLTPFQEFAIRAGIQYPDFEVTFAAPVAEE